VYRGCVSYLLKVVHGVLRNVCQPQVVVDPHLPHTLRLGSNKRSSPRQR